MPLYELNRTLSAQRKSSPFWIILLLTAADFDSAMWRFESFSHPGQAVSSIRARLHQAGRQYDE
jgi:hypothetical protein